MISCVKDDILSPFESAYANRHLVYAILEAIVAALFEELRAGTKEEGNGSVDALLKGRGVGVEGG